MRTPQWGLVSALVVCVAALQGCDSGPASQVKTYYYKGVNTTRSADGQVTGTGETLLRRVFDGPRNQIIENVITLDEQQGLQESTLTFQVTGSTFEDAARGVTGELKGKSWEWIEWTATGSLPNGLTLVSTSSISPEKVIVDMSFKSGDAVQFTLKHEIASVLGGTFAEQREKWMSR
jgi:hypothetical protein